MKLLLTVCYIFLVFKILENFSNMQLNLNNKLLNTCTYTNKKTLIKNGYYLLIHSNPVKNNISLKNNIIITGPNATDRTT